MATIKEVAKLAGVSVATVSYVFSGARSVRVQTEERVRDAAKHLGYLPNAAARALATKSGRILAVLVSDIGNPFFAPVFRGIESQARSAGYTVMIADTQEDPEREDDYLQRFARHYVDGLIVSPSSEGSAPSPALDRWHRNVVVINRRLPSVHADFVATDNQRGAYELTRHLLERGHTSVALIAGDCSLSTHRERFEGYREALQSAGLELNDDLLKHVGTTAAAAYEATRELFRFRWSDRPTALFATSGIHATGAYQAALELGLRIPQDLSFVAFDRADWMTLVTPPITTVEQPAYDIGRLSAKLLIARLNAGAGNDSRAVEHHLLDPVLREGRSVAELRSAVEGGE